MIFVRRADSDSWENFTIGGTLGSYGPFNTNKTPLALGLPRPSRFLHGGLKRGRRGRREPSVNLALDSELSSVSQTKDKRQKFILVSELSAVGRIIDRIYRLYKSRKYLLSAPDNWPNKWDLCYSLLLVRQMIKLSNEETYTRIWFFCCRPENWPNKCHLCHSRNCLRSAEQMPKWRNLH